MDYFAKLPSIPARLILALLGMLLSAIAVCVQEVTPSAVPASPTPCRPVSPVLVKRVEPEYPGALQKQRVQGVVVLEAVVALDGSIADIRVLQSPAESLTKLARDAFQQWRYKPALLDCKPVRVYITNRISFALGK